MKKYFISFLIGLILVGIGCGTIGFEILKYQYQDEVHRDVKQKMDYCVYELDGAKQYTLQIQEGTTEIVYTDDLEDRFRIEITYPEEYLTLDYLAQNVGNQYYITLSYQEHWNEGKIQTAFDLFLQDLRNKTIYNYKKTFEPKVTVYVSMENAKYIHVEKDGKEGRDVYGRSLSV